MAMRAAVAGTCILASCGSSKKVLAHYLPNLPALKIRHPMTPISSSPISTTDELGNAGAMASDASYGAYLSQNGYCHYNLKVRLSTLLLTWQLLFLPPICQRDSLEWLDF
jgi:hypothetical protein